MQVLLLVAEHDGPAMFARIGVIQAINRHVARAIDPPGGKTSIGTAKADRT